MKKRKKKEEEEEETGRKYNVRILRNRCGHYIFGGQCHKKSAKFRV